MVSEPADSDVTRTYAHVGERGCTPVRRRAQCGPEGDAHGHERRGRAGRPERRRGGVACVRGGGGVGVPGGASSTPPGPSRELHTFRLRHYYSHKSTVQPKQSAK